MIGVGIWIPAGMASATILDAHLAGRRDALVTWTPDVAKDVGYLTQWLNQHGYQFNVLAALARRIRECTLSPSPLGIRRRSPCLPAPTT